LNSSIIEALFNFDIHNLGSYVVKIKLHPEVNAEVKIEVIS